MVLLPLFFRFTPLARPSLADRLEQLASRAGTRVVGVYEWALGDKTRRANAALTGLGSTRRILVSDTMLADYSDDEIEVVLAHELGHHVHHDIWMGIALESALILLGLGVTDVVLRLAGPSLGVSSPADLAGMPLLVLAAGTVSLVLTPAALALSRRHERRADRFALQLTANPSAFISAMRRLGAQNLAEERPSRLVQWLFHSHPPLEERLAFARAWQGDVRQPQRHEDTEDAQSFIGFQNLRSSVRLRDLSVSVIRPYVRLLILVHDQLAVHLPASLVLSQIAIDGERAGLIGPELEGDRVSAADPLGDAVGIHREAVSDVRARQGDLHQVVQVDLEPRRLERVLARDDRETALIGGGLLRGHSGATSHRPAPVSAIAATRKERDVIVSAIGRPATPGGLR